MPAGSRVAVVGFFALAVSLAGCAGSPTVFPGGANGVPDSAPHETGNGDFPVQIRVIKESGRGESVVGAPIVIYPIEKPASAPSINQLLSANATLGGRTGPDGVLTAWLDRGATYSFVTSVPNWTQEARHLVKITDDFRDRPLLITIFETRKVAHAEGVVPTTPKLDLPFVRSSGVLSSQPVWYPRELKFHDDPASNRQYVYRLMTALSKMTWTVNPGEYAELGLRVGFMAEGQTSPVVFWDVNRPGSPTTPPIGTFEETLHLQPRQLALGDEIRNARLMIGPITSEGVFAPDGIKWKVETESTFGTEFVAPGPRPYHYPGIPGPTAVLGLLVLFGVVALRRTSE